MRLRIYLLLLVPALAQTALAQTADSGGTCFLRSPPKGHALTAVILNIWTPAQAQAGMVLTQRMAQGPIDPAYVTQLRVGVRVEQTGARVGALVPAGMDVQIGQRVTFISAHLSPNLPCHYIPNLIVNPLVS